MTERDEPLPPPDDADISRLLGRYRHPARASDSEPSREHLAESWRDALDEGLLDAVEEELEREFRD